MLAGDRQYPAARVIAGQWTSHVDHRLEVGTDAVSLEHDHRHWFRGSDRLRNREAFREGRIPHGRHRQRHAQPFFRRRKRRPGKRATAWWRRFAVTNIMISTFATPQRSASYSSSTSTKIAAVVHTAAQPSHDWAARDPQTDFTVNANGTLNLLEARAKFCPGSAVRFHLDEQGLRRHAESPAAARTAVALGDRAGPRIRARHFRNDEHRSHEALALRRIEGGRGHSGAGVRPLFRHADGLFPRRLPDRSRACRNASCTVFSPTS